jgi:hypothetical protein
VNGGGASHEFIDLTGWSFCALQDSVARHQALIDRIAPAARNIHAYWLARRARRKKERQLNKAPATIHAVRLWPEVRALPLGAERRVALSGASEIRSATRRLKLRRFGKLATASILRLHQFF